MCILVLGGTQVSAAHQITVNIQNNWPIDIVLTSGETILKLETFKTGITEALVAAGVARGRINITAAETKSVSLASMGAAHILATWKRWGDPTSAFVYNSTLDAIVNNNPMHCFRAGYYNPAAEIQDGLFKISGDITSYPHALTAYNGFTFRQNGYRDYYAVIWQEGYGSACGMFVGQPYTGLCVVRVQGCPGRGFGCNEGVWDARCQHARVLAQNSEAYSLHRKYNWRVEYDKGAITVWIDNTLKLTATDTNPLPPGTYGIISVHGGGRYSNINITQGDTKDLVDAVRAPAYTPNSGKFIIDVSDKPRKDFASGNLMAELTQRLAADNVHYIGWGTTTSQASIQSFIQHNEGNGMYFLNTSSTLYRDTARYIEPIVNKALTSQDDLYLLQGKNYSFETN